MDCQAAARDSAPNPVILHSNATRPCIGFPSRTNVPDTLALAQDPKGAASSALRDLVTATRFVKENGSKLPHSTESRQGSIWSAAACRRFRGASKPKPHAKATRVQWRSSRRPNAVSCFAWSHGSEAIGCARCESRCANALRALSRLDRHHRHQDEVLRRILRLQRLPPSARRPPNRSLAGKRVDAKRHPLWRLPHGANHKSIHALRFPLPKLPRAV